MESLLMSMDIVRTDDKIKNVFVAKYKETSNRETTGLCIRHQYKFL